MSNGYRWELLSDGKGGAWLNYWDALHGVDVSLHIIPPGAVRLTNSDDLVDVPVESLPRFLLAWLEKQKEGGDE